MIKDIYIVWKKEIRELFSSYRNVQTFVFKSGIFLIFFGIFLPLRQKDLWLSELIPGLVFASVPLFVSNWFIADSIAGERERKTLETLLATRLPDRCILIGKICAAMTLSWLFTLSIMAVSLITLNIACPAGPIILYPLFTILCAGYTSLGTGLCISIVGIAISMRASSVREAQQTLGIPLMIFFLFIGFVLPEIVERIPETTGTMMLSFLANADRLSLLMTGSHILIGIGGLLLLLLISKFNRSEILENP